MTIAVSGTRAPMTPAWERVVMTALARYEGLKLHVGDCPTGVDAFVNGHYGPQRAQKFEADWQQYGPTAGPIRNGRMLRGCRVLVAFPGRESPGTHNAITQALMLGLEIHIFPLR